MLLTLLSGSLTYRFCRWDYDLTISGNAFVSMPSLTYELDPIGGGFDDEKAVITMDASVEPVPSLLSPYIHAPVTAIIQEVAPGTDSSLRNVYKGTFGAIRENPAGNENIVRIDVLGLKSRLQEAAVGLPCLTTCINSLGDFRCQKDISAEILTGEVLSTSEKFPNHIEVSIADSPNMQNARWRRGYVDVDGARSVIRQVLSPGTNPDPVVELLLREIPPPSWIGETITLTPGCDGNLSTCRTVWDNEARFLGLGFSMPTRNPVFEE
jgi:hypothetical protein